MVDRASQVSMNDSPAGGHTGCPSPPALSRAPYGTYYLETKEMLYIECGLPGHTL